MRTYYVSPTGCDTASGDRHFPWRTLERVNRVRLEPGDQVLLEGGASHAGSLILRQGGTERAPIRLSSYGQGRARVEAGNGGGLVIWNVGHVAVEGLDFAGSGPELNRADGICLYADGGAWCDAVHLEDIEVSGFRHSGISIGTRSHVGFRGVRLERVVSHDNGYAGVLSWGPPRDYGHEDLTVRGCEAHSNAGIHGLLQANGHGFHSGHGILLTSLRKGLVESCRAHHNGARSCAHHCGPVGIWASNAANVHFRCNESYANRTAGATDGGGFGLDGAVTDSSMEDNYSHDNDGPGFQLAQYFGASPARGNRMVGNRSENDARRNDHGALQLWAADGHSLDDCLIQDNTVLLEPSAFSRPRGLSIAGQTTGLRVQGNRFICPHVSIALYVEQQRCRPFYRDNLLDSVGLVRWYDRDFPDVATWMGALGPDEAAGWRRPALASVGH